MFSATKTLKMTSTFVLRQHSFANAQLARFSSSSSPSKESLFDELINTANGISDYNFKTYFVRRANEDKAQMDNFSVEELEARVEQMQRIRTVQNLYLSADQRSIIETKKIQKQQ